MSSTVAALVFAILTAFVVGFQIALAAGLPWGALTWGGRFPGRLPGSMRAVAAASALLLSIFVLVIAVRAGVLWAPWRPLSEILAWVIVGYCALGVLANAATPSRAERRLWLPIVLLMLASSLVVAVG